MRSCVNGTLHSVPSRQRVSDANAFALSLGCHCCSLTDLVTNFRYVLALCCDRFGKARIGSSAATIYSNMVRGNASVFAAPISCKTIVLSSLIAALLLLSSRQQVSLFINFVGAERTQFAMCAYTCLGLS